MIGADLPEARPIHTFKRSAVVHPGDHEDLWIQVLSKGDARYLGFPMLNRVLYGHKFATSSFVYQFCAQVYLSLFLFI